MGSEMCIRDRDIASNHKKIVHIEREDDDDPVVVVDVDACIRCKRNKSD